MKYFFKLRTMILLLTASCADTQSHQATPPYGDLLAKFPQEIDSRTEAPRITNDSSMAEIFLSLGFYEASYSEFKEWATQSEEGRKLFITNSIMAHLIKSPQGAVRITKTSRSPIRLAVIITTESGSYNYKIAHSETRNKWIIEHIESRRSSWESNESR